MNVGYYFHVPAVFANDGSALVPASYGMFVEEIARQAGHVTFYAHSGGDDGEGTETLRLSEPLVTCVDLGPVSRPAPLLAARPGPHLQRLNPTQDGLDVMLVRGPSALLPAIISRCRRDAVPAAMLLVADWRNWAPMVVHPWWRNQLIRWWGLGYLRLQQRAARYARVLAISQALTHGCSYPRHHLVLTSSFSEADLVSLETLPPEPSRNGATRLLFTGRLVESKGLFELIEAVALLVSRGHDLTVNLVGYTSGDRSLDHVLERAGHLKVDDRVHLEGFLSPGLELFGAYRRADIYVLPTYGEGAVPRTVKEAFAAGLPVVTTSVPAISEFLTDGVEALLVAPRSAQSLADALERVITDDDLRSAISQRGHAWVAGWTNEASAALITSHLRDEIALRR